MIPAATDGAYRHSGSVPSILPGVYADVGLPQSSLHLSEERHGRFPRPRLHLPSSAQGLTHVSTPDSTHKPGFHVSMKGLGASRPFASIPAAAWASAEPPGPGQLLTGPSPPGAPRGPAASPCADTASRLCRRPLVTSPEARSARARLRVAGATAQSCRPRSRCSALRGSDPARRERSRSDDVAGA